MLRRRRYAAGETGTGSGAGRDRSLPNKLETRTKNKRDEDQVDEGGREHAAGDRGSDGVHGAGPGPVARASGSVPKKKASEVMMTGRNRICTAARVASTRPFPCRRCSLMN